LEATIVSSNDNARHRAVTIQIRSSNESSVAFRISGDLVGDITAIERLHAGLGDAAQNARDTAAARGAWTSALTTIDSTARATGVAELRALSAAALVRLGRMEEARPIARRLEQQGYRRPRWLARMRASGLLMQ
jgi:hypothetical protein